MIILYKFYTESKYGQIVYVFELTPTEEIVHVIHAGDRAIEQLARVNSIILKSQGHNILAGINVVVKDKYKGREHFISRIIDVGNYVVSQQLISDGKNFEIVNYEYKPRTLVGEKEDGTSVIVIVDGRNKKTRGIDTEQAISIMLDLGCITAIDIEGDGLNQMVYKNRIINDYSGTSARPISSALLVYTKDKIQDDAINEYPVLSLWSKGDYVSFAQQKLKTLGYNLGVENPDGTFGPSTYSAIKQFQKDCGIEDTGNIDTNTWEQLNYK